MTSLELERALEWDAVEDRAPEWGGMEEGSTLWVLIHFAACFYGGACIRGPEEDAR